MVVGFFSPCSHTYNFYNQPHNVLLYIEKWKLEKESSEIAYTFSLENEVFRFTKLDKQFIHYFQYSLFIKKLLNWFTVFL